MLLSVANCKFKAVNVLIRKTPNQIMLKGNVFLSAQHMAVKFQRNCFGIERTVHLKGSFTLLIKYVMILSGNWQSR